MKTRYSHLIVVPAFQKLPVSTRLMVGLATQILGNAKPHIGIIAMPHGRESSVIETARLLNEALASKGAQVVLGTRNINSPTFNRDDTSDTRIKLIIEQANAEPVADADTLILVIDVRLARKITRVFICGFLGNHRIAPSTDQGYEPGEAGIVDCVRGTRSALHHEGYEAWAVQIYAGRK